MDSAAPVQVATPRGKPRAWKVLGIVAALVVVSVAAGLFLTAGRETTDDAQVACDVAPVSSRLPGQISHVRVTENQLVRQGDVLVELDDADLVARMMQADAELETAKAAVAVAEAQVGVVSASSRGGLSSSQAFLSGSSQGVLSAEAQVAGARAALARAEADLHKAELDLRRAKELQGTGAIAQAGLDNAQVAFEGAAAVMAQARAQLAAAEASQRAARERVGEARGRLEEKEPVDAQIAAARAGADLAKARVKVAESTLEMARLQASYAQIAAPVDGIASRLFAREGQMVQAGQTLVSVVPLKTYVIANFKETQIGAMKPGQAAEVRLDTYPGTVLKARVESLAGGTGATFSMLPADNATGNFVKVVQRVPVRIAWEGAPPADLPLRPGLSADVTVFVR